MRKILLILILFCVSNNAFPESEIKNDSLTIYIKKLNGNIKIDGKLDELLWKSSTGISNFFQREPDEGRPPSQKTSVHIFYDKTSIYFGIRLYDNNPDSIIARLVRRDVDISSDLFAVYLDCFNDNRSGFYFALNAAGTFYDGTLYNDDWRDDLWDGVWEGKVNIDSLGWTVEMRIPFSQLRFKENNNIWGINFKRYIARRNEEDYLVYVPKNESGFVSHFAKLSGFENIKSPQKIEILPYLTTRAEYTTPNSNNPFNDGSRYSSDLGADLKMGIGPNLNLNLTVNPDFGQVEIDPAVINLSDVETFFDEKRPFFIEGASIFNFGEGGSSSYWGFNWSNPNFFYSRRIGRTPQGSILENDFADVPDGTHILGAAKLTGKLGNWNIGTIHAVTSRETALLSLNGNKTEVGVEPLTYYGIARLQKEINEGNQGLGFISTASVRSFKNDNLRSEINSSSYTGGIDGWTFLDNSKTWVISGWAGLSNVNGTPERITQLQKSSRHYFQRPDSKYLNVDSSATSLTGYAGRLTLNKQKGDFFVNSALGIISPKFDVNDLGFLSRSDLINMHIGTGYKWIKPTDFYRYLELIGAVFRNYNYDGNIIWEGIFHQGIYQFLNYYELTWVLAYNPQTFDSRLTRGGPLSLNTPGYEIDLNLTSDASKKFVFSAGIVNYTRKESKELNFNASIEIRPSSNISFSINPFYEYNKDFSQYINTFDDPYASSTYGKRYVFGGLIQKTIGASLRANWTFSPKLSLQLYAQPLISHGKYENYKELSKPGTYDFLTYGEGSSTFDEQNYIADPDGAGPAAPIAVGNQDFNVISLRGNAVLRWEYLPGSVIYFVWTQTRLDDISQEDFGFRRSSKRLLDLHPDNIFLIKFTYWFNM